MSPTKRFLLIFFAVAIGGWVLLMALLGPTGYTSAYMDGTFTFAGKDMPRLGAHDEYLTIVKSNAYKHYVQRPNLPKNQPVEEVDPALARRGIDQLTEGEVAFVEAYEAQPAFQAEQRRQWWFGFLYNLFNMLLVFWLVWHFGKAPFLRFVDEQVAAVRARMEGATQQRSEAEGRRDQARQNVENLPQERERLEKETDDRIALELKALEEKNEQSLAQVRAETEDRKQNERRLAALLVKQELVNQTIDGIMHQLRENPQPEQQAGWLNELATNLERRAQ